MTQMRKDRHAEWHKDNMTVLRESEFRQAFTVTNGGECILFRQGVSADFYPSTGRWRSKNKTYRGGAKAFVAWLKSNQAAYEAGEKKGREYGKS
jgi:hypothetical protein